MAFITIRRGSQVLSEVPVVEGESIIGRDPGCTIHLDNDHVSLRHATLLYAGGKIKIVDLDSTNGSFVNGQEIKESELSFNDRLKICDYTLILQEEKKFTLIAENPNFLPQKEVTKKQPRDLTIIRRVALIAGLVTLIGVVSLLKVPHSIKVPGKLLPVREWIVSKGADGRIMSRLMDHKKGGIQRFSVTQFERGDAVEFNLHPSIHSNSTIMVGDTVGFIYSNVTERQIAQLRGELASSLASLRSLLAGEKRSVIMEAERRLAFERKQADEQKRKARYLKELYDRDLIAQQKYEAAQGDAELADLSIEVAEAKLRTVQSGAKDEQVATTRSRIQSLRQEIQTLEKRLQDYTLTSPISGRVYRFFSGDTIMVVADISEFVVVMPVPWQDRHYLAPPQQVKLQTTDLPNVLQANLMKLDSGVHNLNGQQVMIATAVVQDEISELVPGLILKCSIVSEPTQLLKYITPMLRGLRNAVKT